MSEEVKNAQITTQASVGVSMSVAVLVSIVQFTSPICIWSILNQFQMIMLLIFTGAFIPEAVREYLLGVDFVLFNFKFLSLLEVPFISDLHDWMKFDQQNQNLKDIDIDYGSAAINNIAFVVILIIFIFLHIPIALVYL